MKNKLKNKLKTLFEWIFGTQENLMLKINLSCLICSVLFLLFAFVHDSTSEKDSLFTSVSAVFFVLWIILVKGINSLETLGFELMRMLLFLFTFVFSFSYILDYILNDKSVTVIPIVLATIGTIFCIFYLVCKVVDIFNFIKKVFNQIKIKLFNTDKPATSKVKAVVENSTAFLISIGGFAIAIKTIVETAFQVADYLGR